MAAMEPLTSSTQPVIRHLCELNDEVKYSVIYEIARIETLISGLAEDSTTLSAA